MSDDIKLIILDLDGTLLNSQHEMSDENEQAIRDAIDAGVQVVLATGKTWASGKHLIEKLELTTPGIFVQGLAVYNADGTIRHEQTMEPAVMRRVITFAEDRGFAVLAYAGNRLLMHTENEAANKLTQYNEPLPEAIGPLQNILDEIPVHKLVIMGPQKRINALRWQLKMQLNGQITMTTNNMVSMLEVLPPGASKGKAMKAVLRDMGLTAEQVLAVGDGENDIEMLQMAGIGVAMGNATDSLKEAADHVVADNDNHGVAEAIKRFVLPEPEKSESTDTETKSETEPSPAEDKSE